MMVGLLLRSAQSLMLSLQLGITYVPIFDNIIFEVFRLVGHLILPRGRQIWNWEFDSDAIGPHSALRV